MLSNKLLDPKNDMAFKKVFGSEKNKDILIPFLNNMLEFREKKPIVDVKFLQTVQDPKIAVQKTSIVDVLCRDIDGNTYIVEMQVAMDKYFEKRAQYYAANAYISQMRKGGKYEDLKEVIFLAIVNFVMFENKEDFKSDHVILDKNSYEHDLKDFSFTFLELPKFKKGKRDLKTMIDKWAYYFKHANEITHDYIKGLDHIEDQPIKRAYDELVQFNWSEKELNTYEAVLKKQRDYENSMEGRFEMGKAEGKRHATIQIVKSMLDKGLSVQIISSIIKLSESEIELIKNN